MSDDPEILFENCGAVGLITLNRPKALNALTHGMATALLARLKDWAADDAVRTVVIQGEGGRAFCAGGDIRTLYDSGKAGTSYAVEFYRDEYLLNAFIKHFPQALCRAAAGLRDGRRRRRLGAWQPPRRRRDGDVLHAGDRHRPLPRCRRELVPAAPAGEIGMYLGLTGARLKTADALYAGVATHFVPAARREALLARLAEGREIDMALREVADSVPDAYLTAHRAKIDAIFGAASVEDILVALNADHTDWADDTRADHPRQIADRDQARLPPDPQRPRPGVLRRRHADGIPHGDPRHRRPRFLRRRPRHDHRQGRRPELAAGDARRSERRRYRRLFRAARRKGTAAMTTIAFIGVGNMGGPMARNLLKAENKVRAFDLSPAALGPVTDAGATAAPTALDAVKGRRHRHHHAAGRRPCALGLSRNGKHLERRTQGRAPDRLLDHRHRFRARGARGRRESGFRFPRRAGVRRRLRRGGRHARLHVRRLRHGVRARAADPGKDGQAHRPCRRRGGRAGGQDLQQHAARDHDDRHLRGLRAGREARPRPPEALRHHVGGVRPVLGRSRPIARCPVRCRRRPRTATTPAASPPR
ncbi:MAG: enoyl-CoA hydratase/isomerase family protein [Rhizomicrobium sp.]